MISCVYTVKVYHLPQHSSSLKQTDKHFLGCSYLVFFVYSFSCIIIFCHIRHRTNSSCSRKHHWSVIFLRKTKTSFATSRSSWNLIHLSLFIAFVFIYKSLMSQHRMLSDTMKWLVSLKSIMLLSKDFRSAYSK